MLLGSVFFMVGDRTAGKIPASLKITDSEYIYFMVSINLLGDNVHPYVCISIVLKHRV